VQFKDIFGQEKIKQQLIGQVTQNRIPHAQLFASAEGSNALALAVAFAQYVNCLQKDIEAEDSCGVCSSCSKFKKLAHPDIHYSFPFVAETTKKIDTTDYYIEDFRMAFLSNPLLNIIDWYHIMEHENKSPNINITECRNIIKKLSLRAFEAEYKVIILWLPEFLGQEGNVLLKTLEEPRPKTLFLLVSENTNTILTTILSRTQILKIPKYKKEEVRDYLIQKAQISESIAKNIALMCDGNLNKAMKLSTQIENSLIGDFKSYLNVCYTNNFVEIEKWASSFKESGKNEAKIFLSYALELFRFTNLNEHKNIEEYVDAEEFKLINTLTKIMNIENRELVYKAFNKAFFEIERNGNLKLILIDLSLTLRNNFIRIAKTVSK